MSGHETAAHGSVTLEWRQSSRLRAGCAGLAAIIAMVATPVHAADAGYDVELLDAGTVLPTEMACMSPGDAQRLDIDFRAAEHDRDGFRNAVIVVTPIAVVAVVAAVVAAAYAATRH